MPRISVIVPVFNKAAYLPDCLESVCTQELRDIEIICIDDRSTDGSLAILRRYAKLDDRIRLLENPVNVGAGYSRNLGLAVSRGQFVQFTDADDLLPPGALAELYQIAVADQVPVVRGSLVYWIGQESVPEPTQCMPDSHAVRFIELRPLWVPYFHMCYLFSRAFLQQHEIRYPGLCNGEDPVFVAQCVTKATALSTTSRVTYGYRRLARPQPSLRECRDFLLHVAKVRSIYRDAGYSVAWSEGASQFLCDDSQLLLSHSALTRAERIALEREMSSLWPQLVPRSE